MFIMICTFDIFSCAVSVLLLTKKMPAGPIGTIQKKHFKVKNKNTISLRYSHNDY